MEINYPLVLNYAAQLSFGREAAQFKQLIAFMAIVSLVLWFCVLVTILARMWFGYVRYRRRYRINNGDAASF